MERVPSRRMTRDVRFEFMEPTPNPSVTDLNSETLPVRVMPNGPTPVKMASRSPWTETVTLPRTTMAHMDTRKHDPIRNGRPNRDIGRLNCPLMICVP